LHEKGVCFAYFQREATPVKCIILETKSEMCNWSIEEILNKINNITTLK
jgi:hypothetical protein